MMQKVLKEVEKAAIPLYGADVDGLVDKIIPRFLGQRLGLYDRGDLIQLGALVIAALDAYDRRYDEEYEPWVSR